MFGSTQSKPCKHCDSTQHLPWKCFYRPGKGAKPCKFCTSPKHLSWQCHNNPSRQEDIKTKLKNGKQALKWIKTRRLWLKQNKPNHAGYYSCYICGGFVLESEITLDHMKSRSRYPELRYELTNLAPCCLRCNHSKGSLGIDEYIAKLKGQHVHTEG